MFTRKSLPIGTLFIALVIMLALLGVGYALWSDILFIDGTVETGNVDAELSFHGNILENDHGKDVGDCTASLSDQNQDGEDELHISVTDGYPSYECWVEFDVHSVGSVPIHIYQPDIVGAPPPDHVTVGIDGCYENDTQLHEGDEALCTIYIHVEQGAIQNHTYTFSAEVETRQFNEPRPDIITETSADLGFAGTGWGGWSCPVPDHPYVVSATTNCTGPLTQYLWEPGATAGGSTYPNTPFGYTYTPPEEGSIVQMGGTGETCNIILQCSNVP